MKVLPYDVFPQDGLVDFETILTQSDVITLHVPLTPDTKNMIGAAAAQEDEEAAPSSSTPPAAGWWTRRRCSRR